jgi:hypothetical protein
MATKEQVIAWARDQADTIQSDMSFKRSEMSYGGWWQASSLDMKTLIMARAASALEFLREYAGNESEWFKRATAAYDSNADRSSMESGAHAVGEILRLWADQIEAGVIRLPGEQGQGVRHVASGDVMEQVRALNEDRQVHPAAPIVLAGAALEVAMRGAIEQLGLSVAEKPGISAYARALRAADVISKQDAKDVEQMGGLRNAAAHGDFDALSRERAGLMEQQVNLFLARLSTILDAEPA